MVNMRLLKVIIILTSILSFTTHTSAQELEETKGSFAKMPNPTWLSESEKWGSVLFGFKVSNYLNFRLKKQEKLKHKEAVYFALNNLKNGEIVSWYSEKRPNVNGKVRVIMTYPRSGETCRTYQAYIKVNGKERHMTNNACYGVGNVAWRFYK